MSMMTIQEGLTTFPKKRMFHRKTKIADRPYSGYPVPEVPTDSQLVEEDNTGRKYKAPDGRIYVWIRKRDRIDCVVPEEVFNGFIRGCGSVYH